MGECRHHRRKRQKKAIAICVVVLIVLIIILLLVLYFALFKPKDPVVQVPLMQLPYITSQGGPPFLSTISLALNLQVSIYNPNRATFYLASPCTAALVYGSSQLGATVLPSDAHMNSQSSLTFGVTVPTKVSIAVNLTGRYTSPSTVVPLPISSVVTISGNVKTLGLFSRHSSVASVCDIAVGLVGSTGQLLEYSCRKNFDLNG